MNKLNEINNFIERFMKEIGDSNRAIKKFLDTNKNCYMDGVIEIKFVLNEFGWGKITMDMVNNIANKVNIHPNDILNQCYMKIKAFELKTYSELLKYYNFKDKELKEIYNYYNEIDLKGKAIIIGVVEKMANNLYRYDDFDNCLGKEFHRGNLLNIIHNELLNTKERNIIREGNK